MKRRFLTLIPLLLLVAGAPIPGTASAASGQMGELRVEIRQPAAGGVLTNSETSVEVRGGASIFGGVRYLDLFLVIDTSKSLRRTDPKDYRAAGAIALVESLPTESDIRIGVVDFDWDAELLSPLSADRAAVVEVLRGLDRNGSTDLAAGIRTALAGFERNARPDSSRVMLLFTDGKSDEDDARRAMVEAGLRKVAIHTLLLGSDEEGTAILREISATTAGSFLRVTDPARLPDAFLNLRTTGVDHVTLRVNDSPEFPARLTGGTFTGLVPLRLGANRIVATATSLRGETREASVTVLVSGPLQVAIDAPADGTLLAEGKNEVVVEGSAAFGGLAPELAAKSSQANVQRVVLRVNDSPPFATTLAAGRFRGRVLLHEGENRIVATATALDGRTAEHAVTVTIQRPPACAELRVVAQSDGRPALSISERAVEIVFDASNSMWGRMDGRPKISVAKEILEGALDWLPRDLSLALRVYGHQHAHKLHDCTDSELLVPFESGSRAHIHQAIASFRPRGQTPLAHSLRQVAGDFGGFRGERAVVLVTDGIESCGGDPVQAARALQAGGRMPVHVIGFGLGSADDGDLGGLRAIAAASGGKFLTAGSAEELREALSSTVGTSFRVLRNDTPVGSGTLGADDVILLPGGEYVVRFDSAPPRRIPVTLAAEESLTLMLQRKQGSVFYKGQRHPAPYTACRDSVPPFTTAEVPTDDEQPVAAQEILE